MNWQLWTVIATLALGAIGNVLSVGEDRKPKTAGEAALSVVMSAALVVLILTGVAV